MASIKTKKKYRVITAMNPKTQEKTLLRPIIDERETYYSDHVVEYALKNGYVRGQFHDMLGALNGFVQAIQELGKEGKDVNLSNWLRVHGELTGTVDPKDPVITSKNEYKVCITALKELKLKADAFSWTRTDGPEPIESAPTPVEPKILSILSEGTGEDGELTTLKDKVTVSVEGCRLRNSKAQFILRDHDGRYMASTDFDDRYHYADFEILSDTQATYHCRENGSEEPDGSWAAYDAALQIKLEDGTLLEKPVNIRA